MEKAFVKEIKIVLDSGESTSAPKQMVKYELNSGKAWQELDWH